MDFERVEAMDLLRKKGLMTRMLILREMILNGRDNLTDMASHLEITPQGVSEYMQNMVAEGLVVKDLKGLSPSVLGIEMLNRGLLSLKSFVDMSIEGLDIIRSIDAIADREISKGEEVNLYMKGGLLFAGPGEGPSRGKADSAARPGDMVQVSDLSGVVDVTLKDVDIVRVLPARMGGASSRMGREWWDGLSLTAGDHRIAALDMEAAALLARSGIGCDLEMAGHEAMVAYRARGLHVIAVGTPHSCSRLVVDLEGHGRGVPWKMMDALLDL